MKFKKNICNLQIWQSDKACVAFLLIFLADTILTLGLLWNGVAEEAGWVSAFLLKKGGSRFFVFGRLSFLLAFFIVLTIGRKTGVITEKRATFYCVALFMSYLALYSVLVVYVNNLFQFFLSFMSTWY